MRLITFSVLLVLIVSFTMPPVNKLANTKWAGNINVPNPEKCLLEFTSDSLTVTQKTEVLETMSYQLNGDTLLLKKLTGISPCSTDIIGKYLYKIQQDVITISLVEDNCTERSGAFTSEGYKQILSK